MEIDLLSVRHDVKGIEEDKKTKKAFKDKILRESIGGLHGR